MFKTKDILKSKVNTAFLYRVVAASDDGTKVDVVTHSFIELNEVRIGRPEVYKDVDSSIFVKV